MEEAGGLAKECAKTFIVDTIKEWHSYIKKYKNNIKTLEDKHSKLDNHKVTISCKVDQEKDLRKPTRATEGWLEKVKRLMEDDVNLRQLVDKESRINKDQCCFGRLSCNLCQRYEMSKAAVMYAQRIEEIVRESPPESMITEPISRSDLKSIPTEFFKCLRSRVDLMEKVLKKLRDDQVDIVGIHGMGAIGKTTLVKEISNKGMKDVFDRIVMVEISEAPNIERIQDRIAEQLSMTSLLGGVRDTQERAARLYHSLKGHKKILIILDNIWEKLDLSKVGIPQPHEKTHKFHVKLLLTSREKNVCEAMGASSANIFEVQTLNEEESRQLFRARVGEKGQDENIENKLLKKCGGLPLSIVALADVLRDQELSTWEHYAIELEKPISSYGTIRGLNRLTYSIIETSYKLMDSEQKKRFFMLASLFPLGLSIPVDEMMRYGIGLGLFQHVNKLTEAMEQAKTWADELKSSSLLLEDDREGHVKIHDVVRASTLSLAEKYNNMFMVEAFPRWLNEATYQKYNAISLTAGSDHSRLAGFSTDKLQMLILDWSPPLVFDKTLCQSRMRNLNILVLKGMKCVNRVPKSIESWKNSLTTLHLESCELGDIVWIGRLVSLVVLSLRQSTLKELPKAMKKLCNLRLLDLRRCKISTKGIQANVLASLSQLEGLYAFDAVTKWGHNVQDNVAEEKYVRKCSTSSSGGGEYRYANVSELNKLSYLNVLEMKARPENLPTHGDKFVENLDQFYVHISNEGFFLDSASLMIQYDAMEFSRVVVFSSLNFCSVMEKSCAKALVKKTETLCLEGVEGLKHYLVHNELKQQQQETESFELFSSIKQLVISRCKELGECVTWSQFSKLQVLILYELPELHPYVLRIDLLPPNLSILSVRWCFRLKYIFGNKAEKKIGNKDEDILIRHNIINLPSLRKLRLEILFELESAMEPMEVSARGSCSSAFFSEEKLIFEALEELSLCYCYGFTTVWDPRIPHSYSKQTSYLTNFHNLKEINIVGCDKLVSVGSLSIAATLVQLNRLTIQDCDEIREGMIEEETNEVLSMLRDTCDININVLSLFPSLRSLSLWNCPKLKRFIKTPTQSCVSVEFPSLQFLHIYRCSEMQSISGRPFTFRAPKLSVFKFNHDKEPIEEVGDINQFLLTRYHQQHCSRERTPSEKTV